MSGLVDSAKKLGGKLVEGAYHVFGLDSPSDQQGLVQAAQAVAPVVTAPPPMPTQTDTTQQARRQAAVAARNRKGRDYTITTGLGSNSDQTLG